MTALVAEIVRLLNVALPTGAAYWGLLALIEYRKLQIADKTEIAVLKRRQDEHEAATKVVIENLAASVKVAFDKLGTQDMSSYINRRGNLHG